MRFVHAFFSFEVQQGILYAVTYFNFEWPFILIFILEKIQVSGKWEGHIMLSMLVPACLHSLYNMKFSTNKENKTGTKSGQPQVLEP